VAEAEACEECRGTGRAVHAVPCEECPPGTVGSLYALLARAASQTRSAEAEAEPCGAVPCRARSARRGPWDGSTLSGRAQARRHLYLVHHFRKTKTVSDLVPRRRRRSGTPSCLLLRCEKTCV
jgi:hypothetical protein